MTQFVYELWKIPECNEIAPSPCDSHGKGRESNQKGPGTGHGPQNATSIFGSQHWLLYRVSWELVKHQLAQATPRLTSNRSGENAGYLMV